MGHGRQALRSGSGSPPLPSPGRCGCASPSSGRSTSSIIWFGMEAVRRFENWAAPFLMVVFVGLLVWMIAQAGGLGPIVEEQGTLGWGADFWAIFPLSLMGMIAFWSTLSLNMPDFTRFGRSQREQALGQALGLPTTMTLFPLMGVLVTSATVIVYGEAIWDPVAAHRAVRQRVRHPARHVHARGRDALDEHRGERRQPVVRLLERVALEDQLPHRRPDHGRHRHPHPAVEPAGHAGALHLHVAGLLRRRDGRHRGRADRPLLARSIGPTSTCATSTSPTGSTAT